MGLLANLMQRAGRSDEAMRLEREAAALEQQLSGM